MSEWSDQVDWFKSMAVAQGWNERVEELTKLVAKTKATPKPAAKPAAKAAEAPKRKSKAAKA